MRFHTYTIPLNGILQSKTELPVHVIYNMNGSTKHSTMLKKVGTEDYTFYDSIYRTGPEKANLLRQQMSSCLEPGVGVGPSYRQTQENFWT